jgi:hypothetical protein
VSTVVHAYGLVRSGQQLVLPDAGIGGAGVCLVGNGRLAAIAGELSSDEYGPEIWQEHADDPQWLGVVAASHNEVLELVVDQTDVLPMRLPGLYGDTAALESALEQQADEFEAAFAAVEGHVEWGVKVFLVGEVEADLPAGNTTGRDYLLRKAGEARRREEARDRRTSALLDVHEELAHLATHAVVNTPQDPALSGRTEPMLLNAAYLVARTARDTFLTHAQQLGDRLWGHGMSLEVTGPWPPYNFAGRPESARTRGA